MIRGTTPTLEFVLPFEVSILDEAYITLSQNEEVILEKKLEECKADGRKLSVRLTQEETLKLNCDIKTEIQIRARTKEGDVVASHIITVDTNRILKDGVI